MAILFWSRENAWLSNFAPLKLETLHGYPTVEHFYQAMKTTDPREREYVREQLTPAAAKAAGRRITLRPNWEEIKVDVMRYALNKKFGQLEYARKLAATGQEQLVHYAPWGDAFWGVGKNGAGENLLGKMIMEVRDGND